MRHTCPECSKDLDFDVGNIELVLLRLKCGNCGKMLSMSGRNKDFVESEDKKINLDRLKDLVKLAWSDGKVTAEEKAAIKQRGQEFGVDENTINKIISDFAINKVAPSSSHHLVKEYDEDLKEYYNSDYETYDIQKFMGKIASLSLEDPNLKKYREDLLKVLEHNREAWMDKARFWETIYHDSTLETEWRPAQEHMETCMECSENLRGLYDHAYSLNKKELIKFAVSQTESHPDDWD